MKPIKIGDYIPDFSLKDQDGNLFGISNYLGKKKLIIFSTSCQDRFHNSILK